MYLFETKTLLKNSSEYVFEFFSNAENLQKLTPPDLDFKILTELPIEMKKGTLIEYRIKLYRIPITWKTEITDWNPPFGFEDTQLKGPYKFWKHKHIFKSIDGETEMTDIVEYNPKGWPFNSLLNKMFVKNEVEKIFKYRTEKILEFFS